MQVFYKDINQFFERERKIKDISRDFTAND